jgi:hypothetical protein
LNLELGDALTIPVTKVTFLPSSVPQFSPTDKDRLEMALREKELDTQILSKVHETNIAEAQHRTLFVAGWRPFIGWVSGLALCYTFP